MSRYADRAYPYGECQPKLNGVHFRTEHNPAARSNACLCFAPGPRGDPSSTAPASVLWLTVLACAAKKIKVYLPFGGTSHWG